MNQITETLHILLGLGFLEDIGPREQNFGLFVTPASHLLQFNSKDKHVDK
jgi:hypothetical protein